MLVFGWAEAHLRYPIIHTIGSVTVGLAIRSQLSVNLAPLGQSGAQITIAMVLAVSMGSSQYRDTIRSANQPCTSEQPFNA
jgi:hypothetical protein